MPYFNYVINGILFTNHFQISSVINLQSLKTIFFEQQEYREIESLILSGNIESIKGFHEEQNNTGEYLDVLFFKDQNAAKYIVTIYDSNLLEQDPQVIKIYPL